MFHYSWDGFNKPCRQRFEHLTPDCVAVALHISHRNGCCDECTFRPTDAIKPALVSFSSLPTDKQQRGGAQEDSLLWTLLGSLDRTMEDYDIDTVACAQRTICWYVREANVAVAEGKPTPVDTVVEGLSRADWMDRFLTGTAIEQAIQAGRQRKTSCEKMFPHCAIGSFVEHLVRMAGKR